MPVPAAAIAKVLGPMLLGGIFKKEPGLQLPKNLLQFLMKLNPQGLSQWDQQLGGAGDMGGRLRGYGGVGGGWGRGGSPHVRAPNLPPWSSSPSPGFQAFLNSMYGRYGQPSAPYQAFLESLQERRDARQGVPGVPPQGAAAPSGQRRVPAMLTGQRTF